MIVDFFGQPQCAIQVSKMHLQETVLCTTAPLLPSSGPGSISLHDIQTGAILASFKQTSAAPHCTAVYESRNTQGGFMLAAQPDKSILNVYNFQRVNPFLLPQFWQAHCLCRIKSTWRLSYRRSYHALLSTVEENLLLVVQHKGEYTYGRWVQFFSLFGPISASGNLSSQVGSCSTHGMRIIERWIW